MEAIGGEGCLKVTQCDNVIISQRLWLSLAFGQAKECMF